MSGLKAKRLVAPRRIATVNWVGKKAHHRMHAEQLEEGGGLERFQESNPLLRRQRDTSDRAREHLGALHLDCSESFAISRLVLGVKCGERAVNKVDNSSLPGPGRTCGGDDLRGQHFNIERGLLIQEDRPPSRFHCLARVLLRFKDLGQRCQTE